MIPYDIDIVMCIDATASMGPFLDLVKSQARNLYGDIAEKMTNWGKHINSFRVRVILFRDYLEDGKDAMLVSGFLKLPEQAADFERLLNSIKPIGGGDNPEDGLEALGYAIRSKWIPVVANHRCRHIIMLWTDEGTHDIGYAKSAPNYPAGMAASFDELTRWWGIGQYQGFMDNDAKRLVIFAPAKEYWTTIADTWHNTLMFESQAGKGLDELTYSEIMDAFFASI